MDIRAKPYALAREEGQAVWFLDSLLIVKATGEQTAGAFGLIDNLMPPGDSPYHLHHNEDEAFYLYEGQMTFYVGEEKIEAKPGT
jgi:mannose-6-phosphate isomerase-like protein (cupin superfamily)